MNIIITNRTINTDNEEIRKFSKDIMRGDVKNILYTLPYKTLVKDNGWRIIYMEDIMEEKEEKEEKDKNLFSKIEEKEKGKIGRILFFRSNTLIRRYYEDIKREKSIYKMLYMDDMHDSNEIRELRCYKKDIFMIFDLILMTYGYCVDKFIKRIEKEKIYWFPHSFNEIFRVEYNERAEKKILLSGAINDTYKMRQRMYELRDKYPIEHLEHPRYGSSKIHKIIGRKYIEYINRYRYGFTCCSNENTPYIVQKFFEIPGAGSLLIAYDRYVKKELEELGFKDGENYISIDEENMEEKIKYVLDDRNEEEMERIRRNGYEFINKSHTHEERGRRLIEYLNKKDEKNIE